MNGREPPGKGSKRPFAALPNTPPSLMRHIAHASEAGAPVFLVPLAIGEGKAYDELAAIYGQVGGPPLLIPRLDFTVQAREPATHVAEPLVVALETGHPNAFYLALENERTCAQLGDLAVAVFRDVLEVAP